MSGRDARLWTVEWRALRQVILGRDRWQCQIHGPRCTGAATEVDHIVARADGGDVWDTTNLRAACATCNRGRGAQVTNRRRVAGYRTGVAEYETRF